MAWTRCSVFSRVLCAEGTPDLKSVADHPERYAIRFVRVS